MECWIKFRKVGLWVVAGGRGDHAVTECDCVYRGNPEEQHPKEESFKEASEGGRGRHAGATAAGEDGHGGNGKVAAISLASALASASASEGVGGRLRMQEVPHKPQGFKGGVRSLPALRQISGCCLSPREVQRQEPGSRRALIPTDYYLSSKRNFVIFRKQP